MLTVFAASCAVMLVSLSGKLVTWRGFGSVIERNMHYFVSFAAGILLVVAYNLSLEIIEHSGSLSAGVPWIGIGAIVLLVVFRFLPQFHHHHEKGEHAHSSIDANRILVSDAIHNVGDGAVIVVSFASSPVLGIASTVSIMVHEMLQEISEFFVLREAGLTVPRALMLNFLASTTILIGAFGAFYLLDRFESFEVPLMGLAVGSYLVVVFNDLIPHSFGSALSKHHLLRHILFFAVGIALMFLVGVLLPHAE